MDNEDMELLIEQLREIESGLSSGDFDNGRNRHEAAELEAKAESIQKELRTHFPALNARRYRFNPEY